jgi:hypothetical protein
MLFLESALLTLLGYSLYCLGDALLGITPRLSDWIRRVAGE